MHTGTDIRYGYNNIKSVRIGRVNSFVAPQTRNTLQAKQTRQWRLQLSAVNPLLYSVIINLL